MSGRQIGRTSLRRAVGGLVLLSVVAPLLGEASDRGQASERDTAAPQCGHWVVLRACQLLGVPIEMPAILQLLPPKDNGTSMLELRDASRRIGLKATGKRQTVRELIQGPFPAIAHLPGDRVGADHYVTVSSADNKTIRLFDGSGRLRTMRTSDFEKRWDGTSLTFERTNRGEPLPRVTNRSRRGKPCIEFDTLMVDKGDVPWLGEPLIYEFSVHNTGEMPLTITDVKTDCGCLGAQWPKAPIAPDGKDMITLRYSLGKGQGPFTHEALVKSNDPGLPFVKLTAAGNTDVRVQMTPEYVHLGRMSPGRTKTATVSIRYPGDEPFEIRDILCENKQVRVVHTPLSQKSARQFRYGQTEDQQRVFILPNTYALQITYEARERRANDTPVDTVIVRTNIHRFEEMRIPVFAEVLPPVGLYPSLLPLRDVQPAVTITRDIAVVSLDERPRRIISVNAGGATIHHIATPGFAKRHTLTLSAQGTVLLGLAGKSLDIEVELQGAAPETYHLTLPIYVN